MKKKISMMLAAIAISTAMVTPAYAQGWKLNDTGWWYATDDNGSTWHANSWQWVDGNGDGTAECYYFNESGYCLVNTTTPDGYTVNADGAWVSDGIVQTKAIGSQKADFPRFDGPCYDENWHAYYYLRTLDDGTLQLLHSDESGTAGEVYLSMKYQGNQEWNDAVAQDENSVLFSNRAWVIDNGVHISMYGYMQRKLILR